MDKSACAIGKKNHGPLALIGAPRRSGEPLGRNDASPPALLDGTPAITSLVADIFSVSTARFLDPRGIIEFLHTAGISYLRFCSMLGRFKASDRNNIERISYRYEFSEARDQSGKIVDNGLGSETKSCEFNARF
jgi:hypothetical protein